MQVTTSEVSWDLSHVIGLLHTLSPYHDENDPGSTTTYKVSVPTPLDAGTSQSDDSVELGNFNKIFDFIQNSTPKSINGASDKTGGVLGSSPDKEKFVKWRDEADGADLEDNIEPQSLSAAALRTKNRAARRAKAKRKKALDATETEGQDNVERPPVETDTATEDSELETPPSPSHAAANRRAVIQKLLYPTNAHHTPEATPVKQSQNSKHEWPVSNPFLFTPTPQKPRKPEIYPLDDLSTEARRRNLLDMIARQSPDDKKYLVNHAITNPAFSTHNVAPEGIHVFVDISNITIGFHDRLKANRNISQDHKVRRIPLDFFNFSLVLERGRPAAKRVLVGSDKFPHINQARSLGYETNILERVHKAKALKKDHRTPNATPARNTNGYTTSGGASSGSETNTAMGPAKWVEQAVDEILHLKILESVVDADKPGIIVLATGDAAIAEYSGGFLRMVERALAKGWMVELVAFTAGLSSMYRRYKFRNQWGLLFRIVELDDYVEYLLDVDTIRAVN